MIAARFTQPGPAGGQVSAALAALLASLGRIRCGATREAVLGLAPRELCATGVFDRVLMSTVRGSTWSPNAIYRVSAGRNADTALCEPIEDLHIPLASPLVEAEVVRRRLPALVEDAQHEPRTFRPLVERTGSREYVVAPVTAGSSVIALLHADMAAGDRPLTTLERDLLRMFADGVGVAYEYVGLVERIDHQRRHVAEVSQAAIGFVSDGDAVPVLENRMAVSTFGLKRDSVPLPEVSSSAMPMSRGHTGEPRESSRMSRLTSRERQVLALLASGATNGQLADQLTVAESTVKSHVKHILHKLGAGNRAAAIACYLREYRSEERRLR